MFYKVVVVVVVVVVVWQNRCPPNIILITKIHSEVYSWHTKTTSNSDRDKVEYYF